MPVFIVKITEESMEEVLKRFPDIATDEEYLMMRLLEKVVGFPKGMKVIKVE